LHASHDNDTSPRKKQQQQQQQQQQHLLINNKVKYHDRVLSSIVLLVKSAFLSR